MACMWLREVCSCSCLTALSGPAWVLLSKICLPSSRSLYLVWLNKSISCVKQEVDVSKIIWPSLKQFFSFHWYNTVCIFLLIQLYQKRTWGVSCSQINYCGWYSKTWMSSSLSNLMFSSSMNFELFWLCRWSSWHQYTTRTLTQKARSTLTYWVPTGLRQIPWGGCWEKSNRFSPIPTQTMPSTRRLPLFSRRTKWVFIFS